MSLLPIVIININNYIENMISIAPMILFFITITAMLMDTGKSRMKCRLEPLLPG
jgi:hypothetical protein